jgi:hypothetical protein
MDAMSTLNKMDAVKSKQSVCPENFKQNEYCDHSKQNGRCEE